MPLTITNPRGLNVNLTKSTLAIAGANTTYTMVTTAYSIDGKAYSAATPTGSAPTTDVNTGEAFTALSTDEGCVFVWGLNAAGTVQVAQGPVVAVDGVTDLFKVQPDYPYIPDTMVPVAYSIHQTSGTSSSWLFGTANWNATGLKDLPVDVYTLPARNPTDTTA